LATAGSTSPAAAAVIKDGELLPSVPRHVSKTDEARWLNAAGFSIFFVGLRELSAAPFKSMVLGVADATARTNLAAHRCSNRL
jgi:hypothetical protein